MRKLSEMIVATYRATVDRPRVVTITSTSSIVVPVWAKTVEYTGCAPGGGGAGGSTTASASNTGGTSGDQLFGVVYPVIPREIITVTMGAAGTGGAATANGVNAGDLTIAHSGSGLSLLLKGGRGGYYNTTATSYTLAPRVNAGNNAIRSNTWSTAASGIIPGPSGVAQAGRCAVYADGGASDYDAMSWPGKFDCGTHGTAGGSYTGGGAGAASSWGPGGNGGNGNGSGAGSAGSSPTGYGGGGGAGGYGSSSGGAGASGAGGYLLAIFRS